MDEMGNGCARDRSSGGLIGMLCVFPYSDFVQSPSRNSVRSSSTCGRLPEDDNGLETWTLKPFENSHCSSRGFGVRDAVQPESASVSSHLEGDQVYFHPSDPLSTLDHWHIQSPNQLELT